MDTRHADRRPPQSGFALAIVLVFMLVLTVTIFVASGLTMVDMRVVTNLTDEKKAVAVAEAGTQEMLKRLSLTSATSVTVDGNTFDASFSGSYVPDETDPNWNAKVLFGSGTTSTSKSGSTVTTRTVQASNSARLVYSTQTADSPDNGTMTARWNCISGNSPCTSSADIRKLFNLPVLDVIATGTSNAASRKVTLSVIPGVPGLGTYKTACPPNGIDMVGTVQVTVTGTVQVNSPCNGGGNGYAINGNGGTLVQTAGQMNVVGDVASGHASSPDLNTGAPSQVDPLGPSRANLRPPCFGSITTNCGANANALNIRSGSSTSPSPMSINGGTLQPGVYYGGLDVRGNVTMLPGIYVMAGGGFNYHNGGTTITGTGVMIYNADNDNASCRSGGGGCNYGAIGPITSSGNPTINLVSPSSGYYQGIVVFQERTSDGATSQPTLSLQGGNSNNSVLDGLVYAVDATVNFQGGLNVSGNMIIGNMTANGNVNIGGAATNTPLIAQYAGFTQVVAWKDF